MTYTNKIVSPFTIIQNSEVSGGYAIELHILFFTGTEIANYHEDQYLVSDKGVKTVSVPLQGPFTEQWVGGRQHRHVPLNTGSDDSTNRQEAWHISFPSIGTIRVHSHDFRNSPPAYWTRDGRTKRPVNIQNIRDTEKNLGNFSKNYQVLQTTGRRITNNLIVDDLTASSGLTTQFITGASDYSLPDLSTGNSSKSVFVERFNSPGSKQESSRGALDREGEEMSPNIPLPFRNIKIRQPYYSQLAQHTPQFGSGSTYALLPADGNVVAATVHKVHRNPLQRGGVTRYDNWFVQHPIPRNDIQYSWISASAYTTAAELGGYQGFRKAAETGSSYNIDERFTDISFVTGSLVISGSDQEYEVDNNYLKSIVKSNKVIDTDTNTFSITEPNLSSSFSEITNTNYTFGTFESIRLGERPVARALRKNNILSIADRPKEISYELSSGIRVTTIPKRGSTTTNYVEPPVTFKYKPLEHTISINSDDGTVYKIVHDYTNTLSTYANKSILERLGKVDNGTRYYDILREQYRAPESTGIFYQGHKYSEIVWPREENTGLAKTRKREAYILDQPGFDRDGYDRQLGTQRVFWRDNQEDRKRSRNSEGGYYSSMNYLSTEETGSDFVQLEEGVLSDNKFVTFSSSFSTSSAIDSGFYNSISLLESASSERELFYFTASVESEYYSDIFVFRRAYNNIVKRGYTYDVSGEFNNSFVDFYEQFSDDNTNYKKSIGSIYRGTHYKALLTSLPEDRTVYDDFAAQTDDEEILINPKLRYVPFIGGGELNTGSFVQDESNFSNILSGNIPIFNNYIYSNMIFSGSDLYVGGAFTKIGDEPFNRIAKWNTKSKEWSSLGAGLNDTIRIMVLSGSDLYVGGNFTSSGSYIAKWDTIGETWSSLGSGTDAAVFSMVFSGSDLYVGGGFSNAGGSPAKRIAKWDISTSTWSPLSGGLNGTVNALDISGSDLYAGGSFSITGSGVAKWNTSTFNWSTLGSGVNQQVYAIAVSGSDIYFGGTLTIANGSPVSRIAKWNTLSSTWSGLDGVNSGVAGTVRILETSGSSIYIGGSFKTTSKPPIVTVNRITKYEPSTSTFSAFGVGVNQQVNGIAFSGSDMYVGGYFSKAGNKSASMVAKFEQSTDEWYPLIRNTQYNTFSQKFLQQNNQQEDILFSTIDNGLQRITEIESTKNPYQDSYLIFAEKTRQKSNQLSLIPEFRISNNLEYYVKQNSSNFRAENKSFLELDGLSGSYLSAAARNSEYDQVFIRRNLSSDLLKKHSNIQQENSDNSSLNKISVKIDGIKKLLPYNGFFPEDRTTQIANLYGEYVSGNLHGGVYNLSYRADYFNDTIINTNETSNPSSISAIKYNNKYIMAAGYPNESTTGRVRIYSSSVEDPTSWSSTVVDEVSASVSGMGSISLSDFGTKVKLISASNGLNLFVYGQMTSSAGYPGYLFACSSSNGSAWSEALPLEIYNSSPVEYVSGSSDDSNFGIYFDVLLESNGGQEKIILAIGSPDADPNGSNSGEVYVITGTLNNQSWRWSNKNLLYTGSAASNAAGTGISLLSCSSGYQLFFGESVGDAISSNLGDLLVCTGSDGFSWSNPVVIASGSRTDSDLGQNDIKSANFNNKTYVFFSEPDSDFNGITNAGNVFCVTSSEDNQWPSSNIGLYKKPIYTKPFQNGYVLNIARSYSISLFSGSDQRLYYGLANERFSQGDYAEFVIGYTDTEGNFQTSENNSIFRYVPDNPDSGFNTITVAPYSIGEYSLPIFFTDVFDGTDYNIHAIKNNIFTDFTLKVSGSEKYYRHAALEPIMAPGILYNTIKSGLAVDWPCATGSNTAIQPYGGDTIVNAYYPKAFEMASFSGSNIYESLYGNLRSNIDYRVPFENILFPGEAFPVKDFLPEDLTSRTVLTTLPDNDPLVEFINGTYIYGGYEPYISPVDFSDINNVGPKRFSVPFVYRKAGSQDSGLYTLAMSNFLAETVKFFLKDEKMITFVSDPDYRWKEFNSSKTYYMDIVLEKSPDLVMMEAYHSDLHPTGSNGEKMNGRYFGYPINKTDKEIWGEEDFTAEEKRLIHNDPAYAPYTPPYFEGVARARIAFKPQVSGKYTLQEIFDNATVENVFVDIAKGATTGSDAYVNAMPINSSIDIFGSAQAVEVTIDEATGQQNVREVQDSQNWIISPRMETPVLDFSSQELTPYENNYSKTGGFGRGMWSGYGSVPADGKGIKVRLEDPFATKPSPNTGSLLSQIGFVAEEKNVGKVAESKLISEAILVVPYLDQTERDPNYATSRKNNTGFEFINISRSMFEKQKDNLEKGKLAISPGDIQGIQLEQALQSTSITEMIEKMQKYVIPPEMNFLEYTDIDPFVMYVVEFEHVLDQQDLVDIWQGVMPKISYTPEMDSVSIGHNSAPYELWEGREIPENLRWMVFKVKRKAEYNYFNITATTRDDNRFQFNKTIGRKESPYSYNWPYDYFSLVEFAKVEIELDYKKKE